jgi:hypothetical protein
VGAQAVGVAPGIFVTRLDGSNVLPTSPVSACEQVVVHTDLGYKATFPSGVIGAAYFGGTAQVLAFPGSSAVSESTSDVAPSALASTVIGPLGEACADTDDLAMNNLTYTFTAADIAAGSVKFRFQYAGGTILITPCSLRAAGSVEFPVQIAAPCCQLLVTKECVIPPPPPVPFDCSAMKPIDSLSMIWNGSQTIGLKAWKGAINSTLLATINNISNGQKVTVTGFAGSPNDVVWEIFDTTVAGTKIGNSDFHLSCSDADMNGPEDCGKAEGDAKGLTGFINEWIFAGMAGNGVVVDCFPTPPTATDTCSVPEAPNANCDTLGKPTSLTFQYTGGGCAASNNPQSGKATCSGSIDPALPIVVRSLNGYTISPTVVNPGGTFVVSAGSFAAQSTFILSNNIAGGGEVTNSIHTSCSQLLEVGNIFGDLTLVGFNGQAGGSSITYRYNVMNGGASPLDNVFLTDDKLGAIAGPFGLLAGETKTFDVATELTGTTTNTATATVQGQNCTASSGPVVVTVFPNCPIWANAVSFKDKQLKRSISNTGSTKVTMTGLTLTWPASNGKLLKVKLDGDVAWETKSAAGATSITINSGELTADVNKKSINPGSTRVLVLEFENNASTNVGAYTLTVSFGSCVLSL